MLQETEITESGHGRLNLKFREKEDLDPKSRDVLKTEVSKSASYPDMMNHHEESKAEKENLPDTKPEETKEETPEKADTPSVEIPTIEENPSSENPEKTPADSRNGTSTEPSPKTVGEEKSDTDTGTEKTTSSKPSEDLGSSPISPESISADTTSSPTNTSTEEIGAAIEELQRRAGDAAEKANSLLLMENLLKAVSLHNRLVKEQTEKLATFKTELLEESKKQKTELECEMTELRRCLVATMQTYSECLSLKTNGIHSRIEESLDKLEMNSNCLCEGTRKLIEEDRTVIHRIPAIVEEELTRAANETSDYVRGALKETVDEYTTEIKVSTKFLKKQVEERKKASRFEKVTDVLMRVCCPILAAGTFVLACVVTCFV